MSTQPPVPLSRSILPPLEELIPHLESIWQSRVLTNVGPYHQRFESALADYLNAPHITLVTNATLGLLLALRTVASPGEVITTPFSFVASGHSLLWCGLTPVFVDIDPDTLNLDPSRIEESLTPRTAAIMPVHCFGRPCDTSAIDAIAQRRGVPVVYDAAHAFGVRVRNESVVNAGDFSVLSFHASKVFNTFEGGAVVSRDAASKLRLDRMRNYGIVDEFTVESVGLNAKMSEFNAAVGLLQLQRIDAAIAARQAIDERYRGALAQIRGLRCLESLPGERSNFGYMPILVEPDYPVTTAVLYRQLKERGINARRYFRPLISQMSMYSHLPSAAHERLPNATRVVEQVLCLPIYPELDLADQDRVIDALAGN